MNTAKFFLAITASFMLLACAQTPVQEKQDPNRYVFPELEEVESIRNRDIDGWNQIDRQSLIVNTSPTKYYLIILKRPTHDLRYAHAISFGENGYVYSKFDRIQIIDSSLGLQPLPAYIKRIYKIEGKEQREKVRAAILAYDSGKK